MAFIFGSLRVGAGIIPSPHRSVIQVDGRGKVESEVFSNWAAIESVEEVWMPPGVTLARIP